MPSRAVAMAIASGLGYIASQQLQHGGFESFSSPSRTNFRLDKTYQTTFVPSLVLAALSGVDDTRSRAIRQRIAGFLKREASPQWSFNYWAKATPEYKAQPYPDDLDDTFCALSGLWLHDPQLVNEPVLARLIKVLLATEAAVGGPYRSWLVPQTAKPAWLDVDVAVNSNVAYFLSLIGNPLPKLTDWIDQAIVGDRLKSRYYPSAYPVVYYMARGYAGRHRAGLVKVIRHLLTQASNSLERALCLASLARLGTTPSRSAIAALLKGQGQDGAWPAAAFCLDPEVDGRAYYNGAAALTTAFAVEALALCRQAQAKAAAAPQPAQQPPPARPSANYQPVLALAEDQCRSLAPELRATTLDSLHKLATSRNGAEIINLPFGLNRSLRRPLRGDHKSFFDSLSLANLYGWLAYTIYDDFLDEEGQPRLLPSANVAMRGSLRCFYQAIPRKASFQSLVREVFDTIDGANAWEQAHCRFPVEGNKITIQQLPDYGDLSPLAERSLGHTLTPLAVLAAQGIGVRSAAFRQARQALHHYLVVRQLNDDVHDWQSDLQSGHINYVVARVLADIGTTAGPHRLPTLIMKARRQFWRQTLPAISQDMQQHINKSRQALQASQLLATDNTIERLLGSFETSLAETLATQRQTVRFLKHYQQPAATT